MEKNTSYILALINEDIELNNLNLHNIGGFLAREKPSLYQVNKETNSVFVRELQKQRNLYRVLNREKDVIILTLSKTNLLSYKSIIYLIYFQYFLETRLMLSSFISSEIVLKKYLPMNLFKYYFKVLSFILEDSLTTHFFNRIKMNENCTFGIIDGLDFIQLMNYEECMEEEIDIFNVLNYNHNLYIGSNLLKTTLSKNYQLIINERFSHIDINKYERDYLESFPTKDLSRLTSNIINEYIIPILNSNIDSIGFVSNMREMMCNLTFPLSCFDYERIDYISNTPEYSLLLFNEDNEVVDDNNIYITLLPDFIYLLIRSTSILSKDMMSFYDKPSMRRLLYLSNLEESDQEYEEAMNYKFETSFVTYEELELQSEYEELDKFIFSNEKTYFLKRSPIQRNDLTSISKEFNFHSKEIIFRVSFIKEIELLFTEIVLTELYHIISTNLSIIKSRDILKKLNSTSLLDIERGILSFNRIKYLTDKSNKY